MPLVEPAHQVELPPLLGKGHRVVADVLDQLVDARVLGVDVGPLVGAGEERGAPVLGRHDRIAAGTHRDEAGQVLVLRAQAVGDPGPHAGALQAAVAAVHQHQRRLMIGHVGVHRADDAQVVDVLLGRAGEQLAHLDAALAVFLNLKGEPRAAPVLRSVRRFGPGRGLPWYFASIGLGSKVSTCDGPPFMNRWTTCLALPGNWGDLGAIGPSDRDRCGGTRRGDQSRERSSARTPARPIIPNPMPHRPSSSRRLRARLGSVSVRRIVRHG